MVLKQRPAGKYIVALITLTAWLVTLPATAMAHGVSVFAWVEGDTVHVVSKFSGGKKVKKGRITVFDPDGKKLLEGLTNDQGEYAFKIPQKTALRVELSAGAGHKGHWLVPLDEITGDNGQPADPMPEKGSPDKPAGRERVIPGNDARLEAAIEKVLDRKLKPLMKLLVEEKQSGPSLTEILGGIGYIIGLVGIAAYFKNRKNE